MNKRVYFASDHAGFALKNILLVYVRDELKHDVEDCGAYDLDVDDDYPFFAACAAREVAIAPDKVCAVIIGGSGQGEAIVANRFKGVRAAVYYGASGKVQKDGDGNTLDIITSSRVHNNANVLALGARFLDEEEAKMAVKRWLVKEFPGEERHRRRIEQIDNVCADDN